MKTLGTTIKSYRLNKNLTQWDMADKLGISQSSYSRIEGDLIEPSVESLYRLSKELDFSIDELLDSIYNSHEYNIESQNLKKKL
ncbi:MAG: helix-turn-helix transcriptional regulator [Acholeplasmatales bacterium]|nr:helix-turn-helix transcriptional regulator [Acholeplasmatales bacterium]